MVSDNTFESESSAHYNSSLKANQLDLDITAHLEKIDNFPSTSATDTKMKLFWLMAEILPSPCLLLWKY